MKEGKEISINLIDNSWIEIQKEKSETVSRSFSDENKSDDSNDKLSRIFKSEVIVTPIKSYCNKQEDVISNNSSLLTCQKSQNISCKIHKKEFITVDTTKFKIYCSKCSELGDTNTNLELREEEINLTPPQEIECHIHQNIKGTFYCNDCQDFICKQCFANEHRNHKSNLPSEIALTYKSQLTKIMEDISGIKPRIDESLRSISEIDKKIKLIRESSISKMKSLVSTINTIVKSKYENLVKQFESTFEDVDSEVESVCKRLESLQKKSVKYTFDINEIVNYLTSHETEDPTDLLEYKKNKKSLMIDTLKAVQESENFINFKIENTKIKVSNKLVTFNKQIEKFFKQIQIYEKSVLNSLTTGISSSSLRLRRFNKFSKNNYRYYKTSSLICKVNTPICLVGLGLCGLYLKEKITNLNSNIAIQIEICEFNQDEKQNARLIQESHNLTYIQNQNDPTMLLYLNKAIIFKPGLRYLITVGNLHKDSYLELWCGEVAKVFLNQMMQFVHCNTSGIHFEFYPSEGIQSDFNEFNTGLIADLIYSVTG